MKPETIKASPAATGEALGLVKTDWRSPMKHTDTSPKSAIAAKAYEARLELEQADMRLCGVMAAHHMIHSNAESDSRISPELLYPFLMVLDDALEQIRGAMEAAEFVLSEVQRGGSDAWS